MALQVNASKGGFVIDNAYIVAVSVRIEKFMRPTTDNDGSFTGNVLSTQSMARFNLYASKTSYEEDFNSNLYTFAAEFTHVDGADPVAEAYQAFKDQQNQATGWTFENFTDVE